MKCPHGSPADPCRFEATRFLVRRRNSILLRGEQLWAACEFHANNIMKQDHERSWKEVDETGWQQLFDVMQVHFFVNTAKGGLTERQFVDFCGLVVKHRC